MSSLSALLRALRDDRCAEYHAFKDGIVGPASVSAAHAVPGRWTGAQGAPVFVGVTRLTALLALHHRALLDLGTERDAARSAVRALKSQLSTPEWTTPGQPLTALYRALPDGQLLTLTETRTCTPD